MTDIFRRNCLLLLHSSVPWFPFSFLNAASLQCRTNTSLCFVIRSLPAEAADFGQLEHVGFPGLLFHGFWSLLALKGCWQRQITLLSTELTLALVCQRKTHSSRDSVVLQAKHTENGKYSLASGWPHLAPICYVAFWFGFATYPNNPWSKGFHVLIIKDLKGLVEHRNCRSSLQAKREDCVWLQRRCATWQDQRVHSRLLFELHEHKNSLYLCRSVICLTCSSAGGSLRCTQPHECTCAQTEACTCRVHATISCLQSCQSFFRFQFSSVVEEAQVILVTPWSRFASSQTQTYLKSVI